MDSRFGRTKRARRTRLHGCSRVCPSLSARGFVHAIAGNNKELALTGINVSAALWVLLGSALGGMARYWLSGVVARAIGETFPWGTLVVNVSGAFAIGTVFGVLAPFPGVELHPAINHLFILGFLGSYTTVSSFSLQTLTLARNRQWPHAIGNIVLSTMLCLLAVWCGYELGVTYG